MKLFQCDRCGQVLHFENTKCGGCGAQVGFDANSLEMVSLIPLRDGFAQSQLSNNADWKYCRNHGQAVCNWLVGYASTSDLCLACELNHYIPNLQKQGNLKNWRAIEVAKHRLIYSLLKLKLPVQSKQQAPETGMNFDFIDPSQVVPDDAETMTGHMDGIITISIGEANPVQREQNRMNMQERYRTLLGHLRHEVGHYYWNLLIQPYPDKLNRFRSFFGDETRDYADALKQHYDKGPVTDWNQNFVTAYASSHPWEDWAETWSHYLHLTDVMETANALGVSIHPAMDADGSKEISMDADLDPYLEIDFQSFLKKALSLTFAVNSINRSLGQPDLYPFVIRNPVKEKLTFIHALLKEHRSSTG